MYSASKGAVNGMMKNMALDLASKGIRVNSVNPAMVETPIFEEGLIGAEQIEEDKKRYPLKRYGKPEEVAYAVIYLLSDAAKWITGSSLVIDGYNGYLVPIKDIDQLSHTMELLINDVEKRKQMGFNSRLLAEREFSIEMVIEKHFDIYNKILQS